MASSKIGVNSVTLAGGSQNSGGSSVDLSDVDQDIVPDIDNVRSLGSPTKAWKDLYVGPGSLYVNGQKVIEDNAGTITISADNDQNIQIRSQGGGDIEFYPSGSGTIEMKGNLSIQATKTLTSSDGQPIECPVGFDNLIVQNLTVNGTTTTVNSTVVDIADNILTLNSNVTGTPNTNGGITIERGDENNASLIFNEAIDKWQITTDGVNYETLGEASEIVEPSAEIPYPKVGEETLTGKRHPVSSKPVYTQTFNLTSGTNDTSVATGVTGAEDASLVHFALKSSNGSTLGAGNSYLDNSTTNEFRCFVESDASSIHVRIGTVNTASHNRPLYVTIEYCKVADTTSSPITTLGLETAMAGAYGVPYPKLNVETRTTERHPANGKPLYSQVFEIVYTTDDQDVATGLTGVDKCYVEGYYAELTNGFSYTQASTMYISDDSERLVAVSTDGTTIRETHSDNNVAYTGQSLFVTLKYTKTADTTSSPIAAVTNNVSPEVGVEKLTGTNHPVTGKPFYTQAFSFTTPNTNTTSVAVPTGLTGVDKCELTRWALEDSSGETRSAGSSFNVSSTNGLRVWCYTDGTNLELRASSSTGLYKNRPYYVVLEYTKTAD